MRCALKTLSPIANPNVQIELTNLNSSAIETIVLNDNGAVVEFTSGPRLYTYALAKGTDVQELADELTGATSVGSKFNTLVREGVLTAV